jgi:hypothetical protein
MSRSWAAQTGLYGTRAIPRSYTHLSRKSWRSARQKPGAPDHLQLAVVLPQTVEIVVKIDIGELMATGLTAQDAFEQAFLTCTAHQITMPNFGVLTASGVVHVPAGVYQLSKTLELPWYVHLEGEGRSSILAFEQGGLKTPSQYSDPDAHGDVYATLLYTSNRVHDLSIINTAPDNAHPGFEMVGGAGVQFQRIYTQGWHNHYLLNQAALVSLEDCYLGGVNVDGQPAEHENGIVFQDPPGAPITKGGSANVNSVSRCFFNLGGNPVISKGDVMFVIDRCYFNGGAPMIVGGRRASILYCTFESVRGTECILIDAPGETGAISLEVTGCFFARDVAAIRFETRVVAGFTFNGNLTNTTSADVPGLPSPRYVVENRPGQLMGPVIMMGNASWDAPMIANDGLGGEVMLYASSAYNAGDGQRNRVGVGTLKPQALLDVAGGDQTNAPSIAYGLQLRSELGSLFRVPMTWPPVAPDHD